MSGLAVAFRRLHALGAGSLALISGGCTEVDWISVAGFCQTGGVASVYCEDFEGAEPQQGGTFFTSSTGAASLEPNPAPGGHVALLSLAPVSGGGEAALISPHVEGLDRFRASYRLQIVAADPGEFLLLDQTRVYPDPTYNVELFSTPNSLLVKEIVPEPAAPTVEHYPDAPKPFPAGWVEVEHFVDLVAGTTEVRLDGQVWLSAQLSPSRKQGSVVVAFGIAYATGAADVTVKLDDVRITSE